MVNRRLPRIGNWSHLAGFALLAVLALVDRCEEGREAIEDAGYTVISLFTVQDLSDYATD